MLMRLPILLVGALLTYFSNAEVPLVHFEVGFSGQFVTDHWNPLRITLRDINAAKVEIHIDQGSLRDGPRPMIYRAAIQGGNGISVFEDDLYIPHWRRFSWLVESNNITIASGSFDPKEKSSLPLDIILSNQPGTWRANYEKDSRTLEINATSLPERTAAYNGIRSLLIDGTSATPTLAAVAAAAAAGVRVIVVDPLPADHENLNLLATYPIQRLGAGWIVRDQNAQTAFAAISSLDHGFPKPLLYSLENAVELPDPASKPPLPLLAALAIYSLTALLLLRVGTVASTLTSLSLVLLSCIAAWSLLRPDAPLLSFDLSVTVGGGDLAAVYKLRTLYNLPGGTVHNQLVGHPIDQRPYEAGPAGIDVRLDRGDHTTIVAKPTLDRAPLIWKEGMLVNVGTAPLKDIFVIALGMQKDSLPPGATLQPTLVEEAELPSTYLQLKARLPSGTALAFSGVNLVVALPLSRENLQQVPSEVFELTGS
jgi:hypothetical protein